MQSSNTAFDRVKSLLGKMDRSIDDARRRRLHEPEDDPGEGSDATDQTNPDLPAGTTDSNPLIGAPEVPPAPSRPASKYGRARPIRELPTQNGTDRQTA